MNTTQRCTTTWLKQENARLQAQVDHLQRRLAQFTLVPIRQLPVVRIRAMLDSIVVDDE